MGDLMEMWWEIGALYCWATDIGILVQICERIEEMAHKNLKMGDEYPYRNTPLPLGGLVLKKQYLYMSIDNNEKSTQYNYVMCT
jgi:hypothetical protein